MENIFQNSYNFNCNFNSNLSTWNLTNLKHKTNILTNTKLLTRNPYNHHTEKLFNLPYPSPCELHLKQTDILYLIKNTNLNLDTLKYIKTF